MQGWVFAEVPTVGYTVAELDQRVGRLYVSSNPDAKRDEVRTMLEERGSESFYKSVLAGAAGATLLLGGAGVMLALAPCPACKLGIYAGLVATQGAGGLGCLVSSANVISRYARRRRIRTLAAAFEQDATEADPGQLNPLRYAPLLTAKVQTGLDAQLQDYRSVLAEARGKDGKKPCKNCRGPLKQKTKGLQASLGASYLTLEERARGIANDMTTTAERTVFTDIADAYQYCSKVYAGKFAWKAPKGLLLHTLPRK